jgi:hypothetical protein
MSQLGRQDPITTLALYAWVRPGRADVLADKMDALIAEARSSAEQGAAGPPSRYRYRRTLRLKTELIDRRSWPTRHELEMEVFSYLEGFYNTRRRHSRLNNLSPTDYENIHLTQNEVSAFRGHLRLTPQKRLRRRPWWPLWLTMSWSVLRCWSDL